MSTTPTTPSRGTQRLSLVTLPSPAAAAAPAQPQQELDPVTKKKIHRKKVADEVLSTEVSYCTSLSALVDIAVAGLEPILTEDEQKLLFSNIATILQLNQNFCANLDTRLKTWTDETGLGDIFLQFTPLLKMYSVYVANHEKATDFNKKLRDEPRFLRIQQQIFGHPRMAGSTNLANFLIMPIQRIPRYSLLLSELIKVTPEDHSDLPNLKKALEQVNDIAHAVNKEIAAAQNRQLVYEKTLLLGLDETRFVQPSRFFVKQGPMTKVCRSKDTNYEFFLFNDVMIYASRPTVGKYKVHREIAIDGAFIVEDAPDEAVRKNVFKIINSQRSFSVYCETAHEKASWLKEFQTCVELAQKKIVGGVGSGERKAVWTPDDHASNCVLCAKGFTFINRRHHCRFCGIVVCGACSKGKRAVTKGGKEERICDRCVANGDSTTAPANPVPPTPAATTTNGSFKSSSTAEPTPPTSDNESDSKSKEGSVIES